MRSEPMRDYSNINDPIVQRIRAMEERAASLREDGLYFYNQPVSGLRGAARAIVNGREMTIFASYSYLGLVGHPRINAAAQAAIEKYGTGTHGVRTLAGTLDLHRDLERTIADFKGAEDAVTFSSGYVTNYSTISALVGRGDYVISDKFNHASIVDGCLMSGAKMLRFRHNDMAHLEARLRQANEANPQAAKLVVTDAVFSMDGDIIDLPAVVELCREYDAWLMMDEAHSVGVLGETGRGIEEYFGLEGAVDIKMGTLSKTIPSVGGYVAGRRELTDFLRHASRGYIFSAALPPAQAAAALEAFRVIQDEPWRVEKLRANTKQFIEGLQARGFNTLYSETAVVPVLCGSDELAYQMTRECQMHDVFILPVVSPAVPHGLARLRATVTAAHEPDEIEHAMDVLAQAARKLDLFARLEEILAADARL
ncbi:MAG TPA: aminotransferase class I/II-fold pyridoxal phosphate-dependent enzyme [Chloroflexi bacterium]|nr:aminotransferase class I/II-fold pyridoxal phosphate-dependent enzyme [Chloroflexota bacterium]